jgi:hypothetical protein
MTAPWPKPLTDEEREYFGLKKATALCRGEI